MSAGEITDPNDPRYDYAAWSPSFRELNIAAEDSPFPATFTFSVHFGEDDIVIGCADHKTRDNIGRAHTPYVIFDTSALQGSQILIWRCNIIQAACPNRAIVLTLKDNDYTVHKDPRPHTNILHVTFTTRFGLNLDLAEQSKDPTNRVHGNSVMEVRFAITVPRLDRPQKFGPSALQPHQMITYTSGDLLFSPSHGKMARFVNHVPNRQHHLIIDVVFPEPTDENPFAEHLERHTVSALTVVDFESLCVNMARTTTWTTRKAQHALERIESARSRGIVPSASPQRRRPDDDGEGSPHHQRARRE